MDAEPVPGVPPRVRNLKAVCIPLLLHYTQKTNDGSAISAATEEEGAFIDARLRGVRAVKGWGTNRLCL